MHHIAAIDHKGLAGHEVTGWNRTKSKADELIAQGVKWADTPSAAASDADFVFSILTDGPAVTEVALGTHGITGVRRAVIGSTAERLIETMPCDVLAVRPPA